MPATVSVDNQTETIETDIVSGNNIYKIGVKPASGLVFMGVPRRLLTDEDLADRRMVILRVSESLLNLAPNARATLRFVEPGVVVIPAMVARAEAIYRHKRLVFAARTASPLFSARATGL